MKRVIIFVILFIVFTSTPTFADIYGGTGSLYQTGGNYSSGNGGEFTISSSSLSISAYTNATSGITGSANSFQTFCLEKTEYTTNSIEIMVSETWTGGGTNPQWDPSAPHSPASHAILGSNPTLGGDDLNPQTAYLYTLFATQSLTGYNYGNTSSRITSAGDLQNAIWYIEGEPVSLSTQASAWVQQAVNATGLGIGSFTDQNPGVDSWGLTIGNVRVLNNYTSGYVGNLQYRKQDQLYLTPIPASVILGILGMGVVGIKLRKYA
jgi:hypothetical protein